MNTEKLATNILKTIISGTQFLDSFVSEGDKEPTWDGHIYVYSNKNQKKENLLGRAPVQVKGKNCNDWKDDTIKYRVNVSDLNNFLNDGGCIYFVVYINGEGKGKIYYATLLPFDIKRILRNVQKQKKKNVIFKELPDNIEKIQNIFFNFVKDKKNQGGIISSECITKEDMERIGIENFTFSLGYTGIGLKSKDIFQNLFGHEMYMYAEHNQLKMKFPVEHIASLESINTTIYEPVFIGNKKYYDKYSVTHVKNKIVLHFGKSIVFSLKYDKENEMIVSGKIDYHLKGNLSERVVALEMMTAIVKEKNIIIKGEKIALSLTKEEIEAYDIGVAKERIKNLKQICEMLCGLGVKEELNIDSMTEQDEKYLELLVSAFINHETIKLKNIRNPLTAINVSNLKIALMFKKVDAGEYLLENYFAEVQQFSSSDGGRRN